MKKLLAFSLLLLLALSACSANDGALQDGQYTAQVMLDGGSGRASVSSPAKITVTDGAMTAWIVWSSPHYDFMIVDGTKYLPVNTSGNSAFEVPVSAFDVDIAVSAETTAMSEPHIIDYTLRYDSSTLKAAGGDSAIVIIAVAVVAVVVLTVILLKRKHKPKSLG